MSFFRRYIYTDEFNVKTIDTALDLYLAARKYMILDLFKSCVSYMICNIDSENVCRVYELAKFFDVPDLKDNCLRVLLFQFSL